MKSNAFICLKLLSKDLKHRILAASRFYKVWIPKTPPSVFSTLRLTNCQFSAWSRLKGSQTSYHSNPGVLKNFRIYYTRMYRGKGGGYVNVNFFLFDLACTLPNFLVTPSLPLSKMMLCPCYQSSLE